MNKNNKIELKLTVLEKYKILKLHLLGKYFWNYTYLINNFFFKNTYLVKNSQHIPKLNENKFCSKTHKAMKKGSKKNGKKKDHLNTLVDVLFGN